MSYEIVEQEQGLLSKVSLLLAEEPYIAPPSEKEIVRELVRLREEIPGAKEEDKGNLMGQYNDLIALLDKVRELADRPQVNPDSPYFAHLRLLENGKERDLCLGKATRIQAGVRIVDWRNAPISGVFYRYQQGEEYDERVGSVVLSGEVIARRTVTIQRGQLVRIEAPEGSFRQEAGAWVTHESFTPRLAGGEGASAMRHGVDEGHDRRLGTDLQGGRRRADKRLPDIAGLIDPDQFDLITRPTSGFVVVRGTAGSGKTTVALHRIAWMAFDEPGVNSEASMFLVFSRALRDYVSHVLPSLGVERVPVRTFEDWARGLRQRHFPKLPRAVREDTPEVLNRLKLHPVMEQILEAQVARVQAPSTWEQAVDDWISALTDLELLEEMTREHAPGLFSESDLRRAVMVSRDHAQEVVAWMEGDREVEAALDPEDDALLLRAWQLRVGALRARGRAPLRYRHIALDEVQDFSPLEVRVLLGTLDHHQSITLSGDTQQHVMHHAGFTSWSDFFRHLGVEGAEVNTLRVAYRSSRQIVEFSMRLLGDLVEDDEAPLVTREGPEVELFAFTDHGGAVAFLADALKQLMREEPLASVAVLTPNRQLSSLYFQGMDRSEVPAIRQITDQDFSFHPGVEVTELDQVKGLEFDYVVLVEVSADLFPATDSNRRLLHVGATRAVHQLWMTSVGDPSPIIAEADLRRLPLSE
ncbi:MAG: AAA family ATPase [Deltaproteobacteria bacterium]|nr:AAA family ATPase [Deltaproteobacteria bacterium]